MNTRLLLQATALAFRLKCTILEEIDFDIHEIRFLTEPKITPSYTRNSSKRFLVYIMNCLHKIKLNSNVNEWCFI